MSLSNKVLWSLLFLLLVISAFFVGAFIGYSNGYEYRSFYASTTDAYVTLRTIEALSSRKSSVAKDDLEQQLDTQIVEHWVGLVNKPLNYFSPARQDDEVVRNLMSKVAAYRKRYPSKTADPEIKKAIEAVVTLYDEGTVAARPRGGRR